MQTNGVRSPSAVADAIHRVQGLPAQLGHGVKAHPVASVAAIAGVSFVAGMVLGSRVARAVLVGIAPVVARRLLEGPLGESLSRYLSDVVTSYVRSPAPAR